MSPPRLSTTTIGRSDEKVLILSLLKNRYTSLLTGPREYPVSNDRARIIVVDELVIVPEYSSEEIVGSVPSKV